MIVVFGGAFNPVTNGHMEVCDYILNKFEDVKFIFLPVSSAYTKSDLASNYDRLSMLSLAIGNRENVVISQIEMRDNDFLGTYQSMQRIEDNYQDDVYFVIGADNIKGMEKWINVEGFLSDFKVIVLNRNNEDVKTLIKGNNILKRFESSFIIYNDFSYNVSSTLFRETFDRKMVPDKVFEYIVDNELYLGDEEDV